VLLLAAHTNHPFTTFSAHASDLVSCTPLARLVVRYHFKHFYQRTTVFDNTASELVGHLPPPAACACVYAQYRAILLRVTRDFTRAHMRMLPRDRRGVKCVVGR